MKKQVFLPEDLSRSKISLTLSNKRDSRFVVQSKLGTGAYDFKKSWGFAPTPLAYEYRLYKSTELPDNNPLNPKYQLFIKLWKKMPISLANLLGPHIVKHLG